jgi:hypothetical protein
MGNNLDALKVAWHHATATRTHPAIAATAEGLHQQVIGEPENSWIVRAAYRWALWRVLWYPGLLATAPGETKATVESQAQARAIIWTLVEYFMLTAECSAEVLSGQASGPVQAMYQRIMSHIDLNKMVGIYDSLPEELRAAARSRTQNSYAMATAPGIDVWTGKQIMAARAIDEMERRIWTVLNMDDFLSEEEFYANIEDAASGLFDAYVSTM